MREKPGERRGEGGGGKELTTQNFKNHPEYKDNITTFFITNFPDNIKAADLLDTFARYWRVGEVFIPARRDRFGKRIGFARFAEVKEAQDLLKKIEGTWFGTYKIRANISRFKRGEAGAGTVAQRANVEPQRERVWRIELQGMVCPSNTC
jgi:RNA recognition motif-containing protein